MRYLTLFLFALFLLSACQKTANESAGSALLKRYQLKGTIMSVDRVNKKVSVKHEEIVGYMAAMTMDFPIKEDFVFEELAVNSEIKADLVVDNEKGKYWLENIAITSAPKPGQAPLPVSEAIAAEGKPVVDFTLTNQDKKPITAGDFKGKTWAITFIYSECPLPNFCIAMSRNFSDLANQVAADNTLSGEVGLLTVSFDPKRDTPEKLKAYGLGYLGPKSPATDFKVWQLASGEEKEIKKIADFFGLRYEVDENDQTQFNHSLRTAVISADGTVKKVFSGSDWKPAELLAEMKKHIKN